MSKIVQVEVSDSIAHWLESNSEKITKGDLISRAVYECYIERRKEARPDTAMSQAKDYLREMLRTGQKCAAEVIDIAGLTGINKASLRRAKYELGIKSVKEGFSKDGKWHWKMDD